MTIEREINGETVRIELTEREISKAHRIFVTAWMTDTATDIIESEFDEKDTSKITKEDYEYIGERAYCIYADGDGYTEYEAVEKAVEEFIEEMEAE